MDYQLRLSDGDDESLRDAILAPLREYNASMVGPSRHQPLVVAIEDARQAVIGGLWGYTGHDWLFTQLLVVPPALRGQGVGTELMQRAEAEARARGCTGAWLDTFEFQARGFYERLGYTCFGELADYPAGFARYFMRKSL